MDLDGVVGKYAAGVYPGRYVCAVALGDYTRAMLYWQCRARDFYAGQTAGQSRYPTRRPRTHHAPTVGV